MRVKEVSAQALRSLRGKRSREVIAHELRQRGHGTDAKAIWRYETGRNQPSARVLPDYAEVLGATIDDLYGELPADEPEPRSVGVDMLDVLIQALLAAKEQQVRA